jgi:hypothetical protein
MDNPNKWDRFFTIDLGRSRIAFFHSKYGDPTINAIERHEAIAMFRNERLERTNIKHDSIHE